MAPPLSVNIIYNKANTYGINDDAEVIDRILRKLQDSIGHPISKPRLVDMREPLTHSDINIHLEIPVFAAIPWAHTNIMLVNPEQWSFAYDSYVHAFDVLIFRDPVSAEKFRVAFAEKGLSTDNIYVVCYSNPLFIYYDSILNLFTFNVGPLIKLLYYSLIFIINIRFVFLMVN